MGADRRDGRGTGPSRIAGREDSARQEQVHLQPSFTPHVDCGDNVVIINAEKVKLTGNKLSDKQYVRHSGYPGGVRVTTPAEYLKKKPEFIIEKAVKGMLPRTRLGAAQLRNLKVYAGAEHPHAAQAPKTVKLNEIK